MAQGGALWPALPEASKPVAHCRHDAAQVTLDQLACLNEPRGSSRFTGAALLFCTVVGGCGHRSWVQQDHGTAPSADAATERAPNASAPDALGPRSSDGATTDHSSSQQTRSARSLSDTAGTSDVTAADLLDDAGWAPSEAGVVAPYADVNAVSASGSAGAYRFAVTIRSADIDCSQFANWWEVLSADGGLIYRRILEHSHTDENGTTDEGAPGNTFTRDGGPIAISAETRVFVRAHMSHGGYRGRVMSGSVLEGFSSASVASAFAQGVETQPPQPTGCAF